MTNPLLATPDGGPASRGEVAAARAELQAWLALGWSPAVLAVMNGVQEAVLTQIAAGTASTITVRDVLAVQHATVRLDVLDPEQSVPATATARRLKALHVMGWGPLEIAATGNLPAQTVGRLLRARTICAGHALAIAELAARRGLRMGTNLTVRARARQLGWAGPLDWDARSIEGLPARARTNPAPDEEDSDAADGEELDEVAIERVLQGRPTALTPPEAVQAITRLAGQGHSDAQIATLLKVSKATVLRRRLTHAIKAGIPQVGGATPTAPQPVPATAHHAQHPIAIPGTTRPGSEPTSWRAPQIQAREGDPDVRGSADRDGAQLPALWRGPRARGRTHHPGVGVRGMLRSRGGDSAGRGQPRSTHQGANGEVMNAQPHIVFAEAARRLRCDLGTYELDPTQTSLLASMLAALGAAPGARVHTGWDAALELAERLTGRGSARHAPAAIRTALQSACAGGEYLLRDEQLSTAAPPGGRVQNLTWANRRCWLGASTVIATAPHLGRLRFRFDPEQVHSHLLTPTAGITPARLLIHPHGCTANDIQIWLTAQDILQLPPEGPRLARLNDQARPRLRQAS